jgi:hypothetical protein
MIGTKSGGEDCAFFVVTVVTARDVARRQPNTCCEQTCQRRATSDTRAPGARVSSTIRAFSSADQRRRRTGPVNLDPPKRALRVIINVKHNDSSKPPLPWGDSTTFRRVIEEGRQSSAYGRTASPSRSLAGTYRNDDQPRRVPDLIMRRPDSRFRRQYWPADTGAWRQRRCPAPPRQYVLRLVTNSARDRRGSAIADRVTRGHLRWLAHEIRRKAGLSRNLRVGRQGRSLRDSAIFPVA